MKSQDNQSPSKTDAPELQPPLSFRGYVLLAIVLIVVSLVVTRGITRGEFNYHTDEAQHAVTGRFFCDFLKDLPLTHPLDYAFKYYAQYPALGLVHWPPFFHLVEGVFFLILGPTPVAARLAVLAFTLLGCVFWFQLVRYFQNEWVAAAATLMLAFDQELVLYEKAAMLEAPSLALAIAASYFWIRYLRERNRRLLNWFIVFVCLAILTKQTAVYLALFCFLTLAVRKMWNMLWDREMVKRFVITLFILSPFVLGALYLHSQTIAYDVVKRTIDGYNPLTYYLVKLPVQLGWPLLILSIVGMATALKGGQGESTGSARKMWMWLVACYIVFTMFAGKETRYILFWLPPFTYFAALALTWGRAKSWQRLVGAVLVLAVIATQGAFAWNFERPYVAGYRQVAEFVSQKAKGGMILMDGELPGNFIFFMRNYDVQRRFVVMRKALYVSRISKQFGSEQLLHSPEDVLDLIKTYGIEFIVVSDNPVYEYEIQKVLRDVLQTPQFSPVLKQPITSNIPEWKGRHLIVYQNNSPSRRTAKELRIRMLTLPKDIIVSLDELGIPY